MLNVINGDDIGEVTVGAAKDAASFSKSKGRAAVKIHGFVAAESFHNLGLTQERDRGEKGDVEKFTVACKADRTSDSASHNSRVSEAFFSRVNRHGARSDQPRSGSEGKPVFAPFWGAIDAGGGHFELVAAADAEGGAVVFRRAIFEKLAARNEVAHDALLGIHAEEGTAGGDSSAVAADEGRKFFVAFGRLIAVGLGCAVCKTDADEGFGVGQIDRGEVEGRSSDRARKDGDGFGVVRAEDLGGEGESRIDQRGGCAGGGCAGNAARTSSRREGNVFGKMGEDEEGDRRDRAGSTNKARLGGGSAALTVTER